jgi:hypothetical protein
MPPQPRPEPDIVLEAICEDERAALLERARELDDK